jgi:hypothetical protein
MTNALCNIYIYIQRERERERCLPVRMHLFIFIYMYEYIYINIVGLKTVTKIFSQKEGLIIMIKKIHKRE